MPDWTPANLGSQLYAWFNAGAITGVSNGADLSTWSDASGNSRDLTGVSGKLPSYASSNLNSLPAVVFDGDEGLHGPTDTVDPFDFKTTDFAVTAVAKTDGNATVLGVILQNNSQSDGYSLYRAELSGAFNLSVALAANRNCGLGTGTATNGLLYGFEQIGNTAKGYFDGTNTLGTTPDTEVAAGVPLQVGYAGTSTSITANNGYKGSISEIVFHTQNDTNQRQKVEGYLAHKYGLESGLASDHPYKSNQPTVKSRLVGLSGGLNSHGDLI
jgi:hypothetical protein